MADEKGKDFTDTAEGEKVTADAVGDMAAVIADKMNIPHMGTADLDAFSTAMENTAEADRIQTSPESDIEKMEVPVDDAPAEPAEGEEVQTDEKEKAPASETVTEEPVAAPAEIVPLNPEVAALIAGNKELADQNKAFMELLKSAVVPPAEVVAETPAAPEPVVFAEPFVKDDEELQAAFKDANSFNTFMQKVGDQIAQVNRAHLLQKMPDLVRTQTEFQSAMNTSQKEFFKDFPELDNETMRPVVGGMSTKIVQENPAISLSDAMTKLREQVAPIVGMVRKEGGGVTAVAEKKVEPVIEQPPKLPGTGGEAANKKGTPPTGEAKLMGEMLAHVTAPANSR